MTMQRNWRQLGLLLGLLLASSCESASPLEAQGASASPAAADADVGSRSAAGGEAQLSDEELERLLEALENELAAQSGGAH